MRRAGTWAPLLVGVVPWLYLVVVQAFSALVVLGVGSALDECFDNGALPTAALLWQAIVPLPLGLCAVIRRARPVGLVLLGLGLPLFVFSVGKDSCPAAVLPFEDADQAAVPVDGWTLAAYLVVFVCFGLTTLLARRA